MVTREKTRNTEKTLQRRFAIPTMSPWNEMQRWVEEFGRHGWLHPMTSEWPLQLEGIAPFEGKMPKVDVLDREAKVVVRAELPGVAKDDVEVTVTDHSVTVKAHTKHEEKEEEGEYFRREMSRGEYQRTLELPETVDGEKAKATFKDGVLELTVPKKEKITRRTVEVE